MINEQDLADIDLPNLSKRVTQIRNESNTV